MKIEGIKKQKVIKSCLELSREKLLEKDEPHKAWYVNQIIGEFTEELERD